MVELKTKQEIAVMKRGGEILAEILDVLIREARPGVTLLALDEKAEELCKARGVHPAFKGYISEKTKKTYPFAICTSVNDVIVHGTPTSYILKRGDLLKIDCGVVYKGWNLDSARTIVVGEEAKGEKKRLIDVTEYALKKGIEAAYPGNTVGDIGEAISAVIKKAGFHVVQGLTGHGIGRELHEDPSIHNEGESGKGMPFEAGMVIAIEPMVATGTGKTVREEDDSFRTADGGFAAHAEHTVAITRDGPLILTRVSV